MLQTKRRKQKESTQPTKSNKKIKSKIMNNRLETCLKAHCKYLRHGLQTKLKNWHDNRPVKLSEFLQWLEQIISLNLYANDSIICTNFSFCVSAKNGSYSNLANHWNTFADDDYIIGCAERASWAIYSRQFKIPPMKKPPHKCRISIECLFVMLCPKQQIWLLGQEKNGKNGK